MSSLYTYESKYAKPGYSIGSLYYPVGIQGSNHIEAEFNLLKAAGNTIVEKFIFNQTFSITSSSTYTGWNEHSFFKERTLKIAPDQLIFVMTFLKKASMFYYEQLIDSSAIDNYKEDRRFEVVYQLLSITHSKRISISVALAEGHGVNSITSLYPSAGWYERETWDMFGVFFYNHPDLRRRLTDYGFKGHPLRKDFPVTGFVEVRYNPTVKAVIYEKVSLAQSFREVKVANFS
jgi:NADH/F420H2 dehydrogenase subunit C